VNSSILLLIALIFLSCPSAAAGPGSGLPEIDVHYVPKTPDTANSYPLEAMGGQTAFGYFTEKGLSVGWNLGNALDSHSNGVGGESGWVNASVNQAIMNGVKDAGFNVIRIPVTWMGHIGDAPDHHMSEARLKRVAEVADMAHNAGLVVIINLHHDGATASVTSEAGWLSVRKAYQSDAEYRTITHKYVRVWVQIAKYFQNYGDWLIFESFNELHDGGWGWSEAFRSKPQEQIDVLNQWSQLFTDAVRSTGGNNAARYLMIPAYCSAPEALDPAGRLGNSNTGRFFILPTDTVPGKQIVTFHYYKPDNVGSGHATNARYDWGTASDKTAIDNAFRPFKAAFIDRSIPVIIGECGATRQVYTDAAKLASARASRLAYLSHVFSTAKKYGLVPVYWDNGSFGNRTSETFGLFNRTTGQPYNYPATTEFKECIDAMINAVK
jgi:endoglucanase